MIINVYALHEGLRFCCFCEKSKRFGIIWRCGKCGRGVVAVGNNAFVNSPKGTCRVCKSPIDVLKVSDSVKVSTLGVLRKEVYAPHR